MRGRAVRVPGGLQRHRPQRGLHGRGRRRGAPQGGLCRLVVRQGAELAEGRLGPRRLPRALRQEGLCQVNAVERGDRCRHSWPVLACCCCVV